MKQFLFATAVLMTTIVGVGMFSLPYVSAQSGFKISVIILILLTIVVSTVHLLYGEIVCRTKERHRLVGYAEKYLGPWGKRIVSISVIVGFYGSLLIYIIVGGDFLGAMLGSVLDLPAIFFNLAFFVVGAIVVYLGIKFVGKIDVLMGIFLIAIVFGFFILGFPQIKTENLRSINWHNFFIPYGAILYSLAGLSAIPEIKDFFSAKEHRQYKKSIFFGTIIPAVLYLLFIITVIGLTGTETTEESISGLVGVLGSSIVFFGALFGFLATITSFFAIGISLKETYICDYKMNKNFAWFLVCFVPLVLLGFGVHNFITIIILIGALLGAIEGSAVILIHRRAQRLGDQITDYKLKIPAFIGCIIILLFVAGFIFTVVFTLK